jgi:hypothetical protein
LINQCFKNRYPLARNKVLGLTKKKTLKIVLFATKYENTL